MTEQKAVRRSYRDLRQRLLHGIRWHAMAVQARKENSVLFATQGVREKKLIMEEVEREGREGGRRGRRGGRKERGRRKKEEEEEEEEERERRGGGEDDHTFPLFFIGNTLLCTVLLSGFTLCSQEKRPSTWQAATVTSVTTGGVHAPHKVMDSMALPSHALVHTHHPQNS